jgi:hypothetical protein
LIAEPTIRSARAAQAPPRSRVLNVLRRSTFVHLLVRPAEAIQHAIVIARHRCRLVYAHLRGYRLSGSNTPTIRRGHARLARCLRRSSQWRPDLCEGGAARNRNTGLGSGRCRRWSSAEPRREGATVGSVSGGVSSQFAVPGRNPVEVLKPESCACKLQSRCASALRGTGNFRGLSCIRLKNAIPAKSRLSLSYMSTRQGNEDTKTAARQVR